MSDKTEFDANAIVESIPTKWKVFIGGKQLSRDTDYTIRPLLLSTRINDKLKNERIYVKIICHKANYENIQVQLTDPISPEHISKYDVSVALSDSEERTLKPKLIGGDDPGYSRFE